MPLVDMPLSELYTYQGINERPDDMDQYWSQALSEMEALGTDCELIPAHVSAPGVECYELYFTGVGGARIHGRLARPAKTGKKHPAVCLYHGYTGNCGTFFGLMSWVAAGFVAVGMDCRGQGGLSQDITPVIGNTYSGLIIRGLDDPDPHKLYFRSVYLDAAQLARIVMAMDDVDSTRVGAAGGSQGGGLTLACAALTPGLNRASATFPFLCDFRRVWEMDLDVGAYADLKSYFRLFDPRHEREKEIFTKLGYIDIQHLAPRIRARVKMITGLMDTTCPPSTQFAAYNKITSPKDVVIYPDYAHEGGYPDADDITLKFMLDM